MRRLLGVLALLLVAFALVTAIALEGGEVVQLQTLAPDGQPRLTRVWIADDEGAEWVEAASPDRPFLQDITRDPRVELVRGDTAQPRRATVLGGAEGHEKIRGLLRARYGWADRWIGMLADTSHSLAVRLDREPPVEPAS